MLVSELMCRALVAVGPTTRVRRARKLASDHHVHHLLVLEAGQLAGVVGEEDLADQPDDRPVEGCMSRSVTTIQVTESADAAADLMSSREIGCLPVSSGGLLLGVVTRGDLDRAGVPASGLTCAICGSHHGLRGGKIGGHALCRACRNAVAPPGPAH